MSLFHQDGCVIANIPTRPYLIRYAPSCPHTKLREAFITINAPTGSEALIHAQVWLNLPGLYAVEVTEIKPENS